MSEEKPPSRDYAAEQVAARNAAIDAMKAFERAAWNAGFHEGFREGWDAGRKWFQEALEKASAQPEPPVARADQNAPLALFTLQPSAGSGVRAADIVFDVIEANPGIRGVEIVNATHEVGTPVIERTVRTALYRMKREGRIKNLEGRWFTAEAAPGSEAGNAGGENDG